DGLGTMQCRVEGNHIDPPFPSSTEIASVFPASGSLAGGTDLTIKGDFFEEPVQVTAAGVPCKVKHVSPWQIICTTEAVGRSRMLGDPQPGNRGLLFEVWDDASDLTEAGPGYRWQFVPNAQSPVRFLSAAKQSFSSRLRGFFVAPQTNNYTFWIQADGPASLYLSSSQDPQHKVRIASLPSGNLEWSGKWVKNWSESWQPKSQKFELTAGLKYYLEALHHGKAPSNGMRVGVQIHNTWLNPQVVNNYYIERHEIWAHALCLPDVQMLSVSGTGWFSISWSNAPRRMIHTNSTALQVIVLDLYFWHAHENFDCICFLTSFLSLLFCWFLFPSGTENSVTVEHVVYGTEPFCGRFSARSPSQLLKASPSSLQRYDLTEYTHVCFAHKGHVNNILHISVSYTNLSLCSVERNLTCQWDFDRTDPTSWTFSCADLWMGCVSRSVALQDLLINTPVFVHQIALSSTQKEATGLFYLDEVIIADRAVTVSQTDPKPHRLGGRVIEAVTVVGSSPTYNVSWLLSGCGASQPLLSLRGAVLCEGSEEDDHLYVSTEDVGVSVAIQRLQVSSPPLGGTFRIHLGSTVISGVSVHISSHQLLKLLQTNTDHSTAPYFNTSDFIVTKDSESCCESIWTLTWRTKAGDLPNVINVSAENLTGLKPAVSSRVVYDGGVFIGPVFGDMLATSNNKTQVVVLVNDVPANCSGFCSFQFSQEMTPLVSAVEYSADDGSQVTVMIRGVGFSEKNTTLQVQVKNTTCSVVMSNQTQVVCKMERLPLGVHQLTLLVRPYGFALNASTGEGIFLRVEPRLAAIEPPRASEIGGLRVALRGTGLEGVNLVLFGSQPCPVLEDTRNSTRIECIVPSRGAEDAAVHVTLISGYQSTIITGLFQYDPSLNPAVVSLSRNRSGLAGGQELQIGISSFVNYRGSDIKVQIGDVWAQIQAQMDSGLNVMLPALAAGWYNVSVIISGVALASDRCVNPLIHYISEVFSIEPCCGSFLGGTLLTISGLGFSQNQSLVSISINEQSCLVTHLAEETIWCLTPPAANWSDEVSQDVPVAVNILISNSSIHHVPIAKSITFNYQRALTPLVTTVELEILESSLLLSIQGVNITGSVAQLGDSECELELQRDNESAMFYQCSLPFSNLEPGIYPVRVLQRQLGYSHVTARQQTITVTPRITSIFPSQGSICGGMLLTISGIALRSRRDLGQVSLDGNYSCELQSSDNSTIKCVVLPETHLLPYQWWAEVSWALNVTVTVNGINSVCFGDCTLHLHEHSTPLVDGVTWEANGTYTDVTIKGQRLAWPGDSPVVLVNDQGVCKVTFWNETNIRCWMDCIAPGEHNISISNRSGRACFRSTSSVLTTVPQVHQFYPQNFSTNGGGLLTFAGAALKGKSRTSVLIGQQPCLILSVTCVAILCTVPPGNGTRALRLTVDGISYDIGQISYNEESTPTFLSLLVTGLQLTMNVSQVTEMDTIHVFVGDSACRGVTITHSELHCSPPLLPAGDYPVLGLDVPRGWASSNLTFISQLTVTAVHCNWGGLNGGVVHLHGTGFSPGQTLVTICGSPCEMLGNATTTSLSCLVPRLHASLAFLCSLTLSSANCQEDRSTIIECDVQVMVGSYHQQGPRSYLYLCGESKIDDTPFNLPSRFSPKVERDEVLIYNSSCNITMETEAEMECEGANQPITAKITEIWKNWGQNTQAALQLCCRWAEASSWPYGRLPQDGANVTVEAGRTMLLGAATAVLHLLHIRGGKLIFTGPGPVELHAHYILITDGGELRVGSSEAHFHHRAHIYLYGSLHSPPLFPYGAKFLAVRNGTLSIHGWMPKVTFTYLNSSALANDVRLVLQETVDWEPGDEIVVGGTGLGDAQQQEVAIIESINNTELYLRSPLRYSHNVGEERVNGQSLPLTAVVALLSRRVVVQGDITKERISHVRQCAEAGDTRGGSQCLYKRSERQLGSRDMGAVIVVEAFQGAMSQLQVEGVQFRHMGQAFQQHRSALTVADSYIRGCSLLDSFGQGLRLTGISNLTVDNNVFFNISGHGLLLGTFSLREWSGTGMNRIRNNIVIGLSAANGLSNIETLSPAGIYIRAPANHIEGNTVCAAGYGYFFHLSPEGPSKMPVLSFSKNTAHSCTRYGLLVYPEYLPDSPNGPVQFNSFTVWSSQGGVQIFSSSNLRLQNFRIYACMDFGIDIIESLGNTAVANSVLIGHIGQKVSTACMSAGLKTPKRFQLFISNTAFRNFDMSTCTAIRTCSDCYQGQGGFTVRAERLTFTNSPFQVSFPFPHAAILDDLDGSLTGEEGSRLLPSTDILMASCMTSANFSRALGGSVCRIGILFFFSSRKEAPEIPYNLTVTDSRNKTTTVNYVPYTLSGSYGWMCLLLDKETYTLIFDNPLVSKQLQYSVTFSNFAAGNYLLVEHKDLPAQLEVAVSCGKRTGQPLQSLPSYGQHRSCDWYLDSTLRKLTYLVTGADLIQFELKEKERAPSPTPDPSDSVLKWSHPETWKDVEKGWGGFNGSIPGPGEDVIILPNRTVLVDTDLPPLRGLYVLGTLEFPTNSSNVLSAACILVVGGTLNVGSFQQPLERDSKLLILLRASEGIYCDHLEEINVHPGNIGVYGKVRIYSSYPGKSWTHLGASVAPGNERILVEDEVDWRPEGDIVISSSSYEAHQAELVTVKEVNGHSITLHERLLHRHIGHPHDIEDGRRIPLSAEVGLLTRNVQIKSDVPCTGKILVGRFMDSSGREFEGVLQLLNIEFLNFGPPQLSAIEFRNITQQSSVVSSSVHGSCGAGIKAVMSNGIWLRDNIVFNTVGPGIDLEGKNHSLIRNLVILSRQPDGLLNWVAGIKVNLVIGVSLYGNVVAGSERIGFHIRGQECLLDVDYCSENVAHSNLHGIHLYRGDGFQTCTRIAGFLSYKNYDYGMMFHLGSSVIIDNVVLVDNTVGLMPVIHCLYAKQCYMGKRLLELRNSTIVATSSTFDCIRDRIKPQAADLTSRDRPPYYPQRGRAGILWPKFTTVASQWPDSPWHKIVRCPKVLGLMKLKDVTFTGFTKSCHSEDRDVCIMSDSDHLGIMPLITAEGSRMFHVNEKDKFYFHAASVQTSEGTAFPEESCEGSRKALVKDLDGNLLGLEPPVSVFPKSEFEWTRFYLQSGIYRDDSKCIFKPSVQSYFCKQADYALVILENLDTSMVSQELFPVVTVTGSFMDTFSDGASDASCRSAQHPSALFSVLPTTKLTTVCFPDLTPLVFRLYLLSGQNSTRLPLAIFYNEPLSLHVFTGGKYISPTPSSFSWNERAGTNYFSFEDNLLYVLLHEKEPVEIVTGLSLHVAFTVTETIGDEGEANIMHQLADYLHVAQDQVRVVHRVPGGESMLRVISDNASKKQYHCPNMMFCTTFHSRSGSRKLGRGAVNARVLQTSDAAGPSKVLIFEFGDPPGYQRNEFQRSLTTDSLKSLARAIINAHQTGDLQTVLGLPVDTLMVNHLVSKGLSGFGFLWTCLYVRPYSIFVHVQPSDGEIEKELPVQPQIIFLDKEGRRVDMLGPPSEPWVVSAHLKGSSAAVLKGLTEVQVIGGCASFSNLAVSNSGTNWNLVFTVTSPPGAKFTVLSQPFTIFPVPIGEKASLILVVLLSAIASGFVLTLVFCWFKKSKNNSKLEMYIKIYNCRLPFSFNRSPDGLQQDLDAMLIQVGLTI
uniref:PKHD1 ciliary IPT domain containing fibrocystin/polyductin n=1 Tax=Coturnix japonica TaxID=93934 RepID=A0A8C2SRX6_COTJA